VHARFCFCLIFCWSDCLFIVVVLMLFLLFLESLMFCASSIVLCFLFFLCSFCFVAYVYIYIYTYVRVYIMHACMHVYIYIYIYVCIYICFCFLFCFCFFVSCMFLVCCCGCCCCFVVACFWVFLVLFVFTGYLLVFWLPLPTNGFLSFWCSSFLTYRKPPTQNMHQTTTTYPAPKNKKQKTQTH